jgi:hypothetical protein
MMWCGVMRKVYSHSDLDLPTAGLVELICT